MKEGTPTLHNIMEGTGEYYAKCNKPGGKRKKPYDLTYNWNLNNKINKLTKYNHGHANKEQTDITRRG